MTHKVIYILWVFLFLRRGCRRNTVVVVVVVMAVVTIIVAAVAGAVAIAVVVAVIVVLVLYITGPFQRATYPSNCDPQVKLRSPNHPKA